MKEYYYDKLLNIKTRGEQKGFPASRHYYRYEPTPYIALEKLFEKYGVGPGDRVVDFGCGKGRLNFYIHYFFKASVVGVEMDEDFYREAEANCQSYMKRYGPSKGKIQFYCCLAEEYPIDPMDNRFYFFNPFSIQIFMTIMNNILFSYENAPRKLELLLYYPSEDYIYFIENKTPFELKEEVDLKDLYGNKPNERFMIYGMG